MKTMKTIKKVRVTNYSLSKSLDCLERMGKLFPIVRIDDSACRIFIRNNDTNYLFEVSQCGNDFQVTMLLGELSDSETQQMFNKVFSIFDLHNNNYNKIDAYAYGTVDSTILFKSLKGLRIIKDTNILNCIIRTIISQQVSLKAASNIVRRFIEYYGDSIEFEGTHYFQFPTAEFIATSLTVTQLREIGIPLTRADAIISLAIKVRKMEKPLDDYSYSELKDIVVCIKGIGKWTVEMLGLFYFTAPDIVPVADLGLHRAIEYLYNLPERSISKINVNSVTNNWSGNKSLQVYYIWEYWMLNKEEN